MTRVRRAWVYAAVGALFVILLIAFARGPRPVIRGSAQSERFDLWTSDSSSFSLQIPLERAELADGDSTILLSGVRLRAAGGAHVTFRRFSPLHLAIDVESEGDSAGCILDGQGSCVLPLKKSAEIKVTLKSGGAEERLVFPYRATRIEAGTQLTTEVNRGEVLLLSGEVSLNDRTVSGDTFTSGSRSLAMGDKISIEYPRGWKGGEGFGTLFVTDAPGMFVTFTMESPRAKIYYGHTGPVVLQTPRWSRVRSDWLARWMAIIVSFLLVQPVAELLRKRVTGRLKRISDDEADSR